MGELRRVGLLGADADEEDVILGLYRYLGRTPSRLLALSLADAVGDRRAQNQPGTTDEYPNWRVPLTDSDGDPRAGRAHPSLTRGRPCWPRRCGWPPRRNRTDPMPKLSAGLLLYRVRGDCVEVLIGHPGGPFWARKDDGAWSIPRAGEYGSGDDPWEAARREFAEELGSPAPPGPRIAFEPVKQPSGKVLSVFAVAADFDTAEARSNTFTMEWPRGSGRLREFPELDRVAWLPVARARIKLLKGHRLFLTG